MEDNLIALLRGRAIVIDGFVGEVDAGLISALERLNSVEGCLVGIGRRGYALAIVMAQRADLPPLTLLEGLAYELFSHTGNIELIEPWRRGAEIGESADIELTLRAIATSISNYHAPH